MIEPEVTRRKRGQTLAEFAITLPILLILLFGIIEFGRIFQAWVTLQNSARAAARYATTGQYDSSRYTMDLEFVPVAGATGDLNSIVPCIRNEVAGDTNDDGILDATPSEADINAAHAANLAQRGQPTTIYPNDSADPNDAVEVFVGGPESLYATWYSGDDCDPADTEDQNRRKDMARILSIYWEARRGAAGLALGPQLPIEPIIGVTSGITLDPATWYDGTVDTTGNDGARLYPNPEEMPWYQVWTRPLPGDSDGDPMTPAVYEQLEHSDEPGWFSMMICSSRPKLDDTNEPSAGSVDFRFETRILGGGIAPACILQEEPTAIGTLIDEDWTENAYRGDTNSTTWLDAGGPGDTVTIVITFNHPLVTPLGLASYLPLQARRTAVNEAFRAPRSNPIPYSLPDATGGLRTDTPTNTYTPSSTFTATNTATASATPRPTNTDTPEFTCASINVPLNVSYLNDEVRFTLTNLLPYPVTLKRVVFNWQAAEGYAGLMNVGVMYLGAAGSAIWAGADTTSPTDVGDPVTVGAGTPTPAATADYPFAAAANLNLAPGNNTFGVRFLNGPAALNGTNMPSYFFAGTTFYVDDPAGGNDCATVLNFVQPTPTAGSSPTATATPQCTSGTIDISAASFDSYGIVRFDFTNTRAIPVSLVGFNIHWQSYDPNQVLFDIWGGNSLPGSAGSLLLWTGATGQDASPPTQGYKPSLTPPAGLTPEGTWGSVDLTIAPGSTRSVYLEFRGGVGGGGEPVSTAFPGMWYTDFSGSVFYFDTSLCTGTYEVTPDDLVPTATNTPTVTNTATNTRTPTFTATNTRTNTATATNTFTRTNTNTATNTRTNTPTFTASNTRTNTATFTATRTFTPTRTFTATFTASNTRTFTATFTASRTFTATRTFTASNTFTRTNTFTATNTFTRTFTPSNTFTRTNTFTATNTFTRTNTPTASNTFTRTNTPTATNTRTNTPTVTNTFTPTNTRTFTPTNTATFTFTASRTPTRTNTPTNTFTPTSSNTPVPTNTFTRTPTNTRTPTFTPYTGGGGE